MCLHILDRENKLKPEIWSYLVISTAWIQKEVGEQEVEGHPIIDSKKAAAEQAKFKTLLYQ